MHIASKRFFAFLAINFRTPMNRQLPSDQVSSLTHTIRKDNKKKGPGFEAFSYVRRNYRSASSLAYTRGVLSSKHAMISFGTSELFIVMKAILLRS